MSHTEWLRKQVALLQTQIASSAIFESETPATRDEMQQLMKLVVIHRFLQQQLDNLVASSAASEASRPEQYWLAATAA